jgi:hypothetical protein
VLQAMLAEDVARLVGAKGRHNPDRTAVRHGNEPGQVTLGGRRVRVRRPRVRSADGSGELPVPTYQVFAATEHALAGGATENTTVVTDLLVGRERGLEVALEVARPILVVVDGAKACAGR